MSEWPDDPTPEQLWGDKHVDAAIPGAPMPAWRWLVIYEPTFRYWNVPPERRLRYVAFGSDDREEAESRAHGHGFSVIENPRWKTLN